MAIRLGINGFGRIGRAILRALMERDPGTFEVVAINDLAPRETLAHLYEFDSLRGRAPSPVITSETTLDVGAGPIRITAEPDPERLPWEDVDIALECTGRFRAKPAAEAHFDNGSQKVLISAPAQGGVKTIVYGVNHHTITREDRLLNNASCTTNCLVPVAQVLHQGLEIRRGHMTTVHCYTTSQPLHDSPHADLYRSRAAALSMIPTTSGAATTLGEVLPELVGRIQGRAIRVPTPNVSCIDLVVETAKTVTPAEVNALMTEAASGAFAGILDITDKPLVSSDFNKDPASAIFATAQTAVQDGNLVRVLAWYDNEWGFANRMLDTAKAMAETASGAQIGP